MENIDFLIKVLTSEYHYWVVAKANKHRSFGREERGNDDILIITIPININRYTSKEQVMFTDLENLYKHELDNIFITGNYPPFQYGISMRDIYFGFPIKNNVRQFMVDALNLNSSQIFEYKPLLEKLESESIEVVNQ